MLVKEQWSGIVPLASGVQEPPKFWLLLLQLLSHIHSVFLLDFLGFGVYTFPPGAARAMFFTTRLRVLKIMHSQLACERHPPMPDLIALPPPRHPHGSGLMAGPCAALQDQGC
jgi:hypothetical protein